MMGRKFEEGDWAHVYCAAKGIPLQGWSNLNIDVTHGPLGVEHKMLCRPSDKPIATWCGTSAMHPAATRAIRIDSVDRPANDVMKDVFRQYNELIERRSAKVRESAGGVASDMRTGWLLWQDSLREFLYFEERMAAPDPAHYRAVWSERPGGGARLGSKNLWVYDRATGQKRFSVTTQAGIKIQPYFDVPPADDPNLYIFIVQGESLGNGHVRVWLTEPTAQNLRDLAGDLDAATVSKLILSVEKTCTDSQSPRGVQAVHELQVSEEAYRHLCDIFGDTSDEQRFRLLLASLTQSA